MSENLEPLRVRDAAELVTGQRWKDNETGKDTPSEDFLTGRAATEASQGFKPMWMADPVNKEADEPIQALRRDEVAEPIPVQYMEMGGPKAGQKMPDDQTVSAEQAAHDVSRFRDSVTETEQAQLNAESARAMNEVLGEQQQQVPEAPEVPQPEVNQTGGDDEVAKMLQNPKLLAAVQQEVGRYQQHYQQVVAANAAAAAASLVASFPELQNVRADQIPAAIAVVNNQEPKRAWRDRNRHNPEGCHSRYRYCPRHC